MNQSKQECIKCIDTIKRQLDSLGLSTIMTNNKENILCKVSGNFSSSNSATAKVATYGTTNTCPHTTASACPYSVCKHPNANCHHHNSNNNSSTGNDNSNLNNGSLESIGVYSESLFRIRPTDIYTGLFLHAIKLHGETCDLKMTFEYTDTGVEELINVIKFLVE